MKCTSCFSKNGLYLEKKRGVRELAGRGRLK
jgi:hypothetical protein